MEEQEKPKKKKPRSKRYNGKDPRKNNPHQKVSDVMDYLDDIKLDIDTVLDLTGYDRGSLFSESNQFPTSGILVPFRKQVVSKLYLTTGISPKTFLIDETKQNKWLNTNIKATKTKTADERKKNYFTHGYWKELEPYIANKPSLVEMKSIPAIPPDISKENQTLTGFYQAIADKYYKTATKNIISHEVLMKGNNNNPDNRSAYKDAQSIIFEAIDKALDETGTLRYERVFYLSPSQSIHEKGNTKKEELLKIMVIEASIETLVHVNNCLSKPKNNCEFYVSPFQEYRSFCTIDNIFICEHYKKQGDYILPCWLSIYNLNVKSEVLKLQNKYDLDPEKRNDYTYSFTQNDLITALRKAKTYLATKKDEKDTIVTKLEKAFLNYDKKGYEDEFNLITKERDTLGILNNQWRNLDTKISEVTSKK